MTFGGTAATNVVVTNSTTITATTPAHAAGAVAVTVTNSNGLSGNLANGFTYLAPPTVTSVSPNSGTTAGGTAVTITGTNFAGGATVNVRRDGGQQCGGGEQHDDHGDDSGRKCGSCDGNSDVSGQSGSLSSGYTYVVVPTVTSVSPNNGATTGGTAVTITGTNFASGATVTFGGAAASNVVVVNSTTITATTPAGTGVVTVTVTVNGQSGSLVNGFTYSGSVPTCSRRADKRCRTCAHCRRCSRLHQFEFPDDSHDCAFDSTGGDLISSVRICAFWLTFTPSDNFGNTWIPIAGPTNTALGFDLRTEMWYAPHPIVGPGHTVTMNLVTEHVSGDVCHRCEGIEHFFTDRCHIPYRQ